jgi:hypothetical protein
MPESARLKAQKINPYPLHERALKDDLQVLINHVLGNWSGPGVVDPSRLRTYYERFRSGTAKDNRFWYTLTLGLWLGEYHC